MLWVATQSGLGLLRTPVRLAMTLATRGLTTSPVSTGTAGCTRTCEPMVKEFFSAAEDDDAYQEVLAVLRKGGTKE